jgi:hypothetical protein
VVYLGWQQLVAESRVNGNTEKSCPQVDSPRYDIDGRIITYDNDSKPEVCMCAVPKRSFSPGPALSAMIKLCPS